MALIYHNITPPEYFVGVHRTLARQCFRGRRELRAYVDRCDLALGDSEFNRQDLEALGFPRTAVLPVVPGLLAPRRRRRTGCVARQFDDDWTNILFVGRVIANKKIEDLIRFFHAYHTIVQPAIAAADRRRVQRVRALSGVAAPSGRRRSALPHVHFVGHVSDEELVAYYEVADLFLCASEHEGFCVPLVEAFYKQVPVLAYAATAVPATMDGAGVLFDDKDPLHVAALMDAIVSNADAAGRIVDGQLAAVDRLRAKDFAGTLLGFVDQILRRAARGRAAASRSISGTVRRRARSSRNSGCTGRRSIKALPPRAARSAHDRQPVGAGGAQGRRDRRQRAARARAAARAWATSPSIYALTIDDDLRDDVRPFADPAARDAAT